MGLAVSLIVFLLMWWFWLRAPKVRSRKGPWKKYILTFSKWRDKRILRYLSCYEYPEGYILELLQREVRGTGISARPITPRDNALEKSRILYLKLLDIQDKDLIDLLDAKGLFYNSYIKHLIRSEMKCFQATKPGISEAANA